MHQRSTPFSVGRRWFCDNGFKRDGRSRFWFVIIGPGENYSGKPSATHKRCRLDVHPEDLASCRNGYKSHGTVSDYSHAHLKKFAQLEPA